LVSVLQICSGKIDSQLGSWSTKELSVGRYNLFSTSVGNFALFAGGWAVGAYKTVDIYDSANNSWSVASLSTYPENFMQGAATSVGDIALFCTGTPIIDVFHATNMSWTRKYRSSLVADYFLAATTVNNYAIFTTGTIADIYDYTTDSWNGNFNLSQSRWFLAATSVGDVALFGGGYLSDAKAPEPSDVVDIYHSDTNKWSTATLATARYWPAASSVGTLAIFAGGSTLYGDVESFYIDMYESTSDTWSASSLDPPARLYMAATTVGNLAMFAGGMEIAYMTPISSQVTIYDSTTDIWSTANLTIVRDQFTATTLGNVAFFAGGYIGVSPGVTASIDVFTLS